MNVWGDLKSARWMYLKAALFLAAGGAGAAGLLAEAPPGALLRTAFLLVVTVWSFCRLYYFLFYVIERYIDPGYRFAGLGSVVLYLLGRRKPGSRGRECLRPESQR